MQCGRNVSEVVCDIQRKICAAKWAFSCAVTGPNPSKASMSDGLLVLTNGRARKDPQNFGKSVVCSTRLRTEKIRDAERVPIFRPCRTNELRCPGAVGNSMLLRRVNVTLVGIADTNVSKSKAFLRVLYTPDSIRGATRALGDTLLVLAARRAWEQQACIILAAGSPIKGSISSTSSKDTFYNKRLAITIILSLFSSAGSSTAFWYTAQNYMSHCRVTNGFY